MATLTQLLQYTLANKDPQLPGEVKRVILKEALQAYVLDFLYNHPAYRQLNFYGGTCLHIVYSLNRLSEDLDLDNSQAISLDSLSKDLETFFQNTFGYSSLSIKSQLAELGILRTTLKFPILNELNLSPYPNEALHLKVEISQHQQIAEIRKTPVFFYGRSFVPSHFSLETLMAGKMLACLERTFSADGTALPSKAVIFMTFSGLCRKRSSHYPKNWKKMARNPIRQPQPCRNWPSKSRGIKAADLAVDLYPLFEQKPFIDAWLEGFHQNFEESGSLIIQSRQCSSTSRSKARWWIGSPALRRSVIARWELVQEMTTTTW